MKIKPVFVGIAVLGVLLLVLSLSTITKIVSANPRDLLAGVKAEPQAVQLLPKRSPLFISFLVKPEKLGLFAQLAAKPSDLGDVRHELASLKQQLRQNWLLDYEHDIQPWLDKEITLAVTDVDLDHQAANGLQTGYLLAFAAKDVELAKTTMDDFWQRLAVNGSDLSFEQYQGISILSTRFSNDQPAIAGTTLDKFVLFANDVLVLREAINNLKSPSLALASLDNYRDRLAQIDTGRIAVSYVNLAELDENLPKMSLLLSLGFDKSGIKAKTFLTSESQPKKLAANVEKTDPKSTPKLNAKSKSKLNIATAIPSGNLVIIGKNLSESLESFWQKLVIDAIAPIALDKKALAWAQSDYALSILPNPNGILDWILAVKVNDSQASETAIAALDELVRAKLTVGEIMLKSQPVKLWTKLRVDTANSSDSNSNVIVSGEVVAAHAQTSNYIYLSNSLKLLDSSLDLKANQASAASKSFKTINAKLASDRQTYGYVDKSFDSQWLQIIPPNFSTNEILQEISNSSLTSILKHLDVASFASTGSIGNTENGEVFLKLK